MDENERSPIEQAAEDDDVEEVRRLSNKDKLDSEALSKLLVLASQEGSVETVEYLLSQHVDVNFKRGRELVTALQLAAFYGHIEVVEMLLRREDIDIYAGDWEGTDAFMYAAMGYDISAIVVTRFIYNEIVKKENSVEIKKRLDRKDEAGMSAIYLATTQGTLEVVKFLCDNGADLNTATNSGDTALMTVSEYELEEMVEYILDRSSAEMYNAKNEKGQTALTLAGTSKIQIMLLKKPDIDTTGFEKVQLTQAALHGNSDSVQSMLESDKHDINARDSDGNTPLILAASHNHDNVINKLLQYANKRKLDVNAQNIFGETALTVGTAVGARKVVESLLKNEEVEVNKRNYYNKTALEIALSKEINLDGYSDFTLEVKEELIEILLSSEGIDVNAKLSNGKTALEVVCDKESECGKIPEELVRMNKLSFDISEENRKTVCTFINGLGEKEWKGLLEGRKKKVFSLLMLMAHDNDEENKETKSDFWTFVLSDENLTTIMKEGKKQRSLLHHCATSADTDGSLKLLKLLPIEWYKDLHTKLDDYDNTMLHVAMKNGRSDIFNWLMGTFYVDGDSIYVHRWLVNIFQAKNIDHNTVFSTAIKAEFADDVVKEMLEKLSDVQMNVVCRQKDAAKNSLLHLSVKHKRDGLVEYLATKPIEFTERNDFGYTALHAAVHYNNVKTVKKYYQSFKHRDLKINERTSELETAIHVAAKNGNAEMIKLLVRHGGDLGARDEDGHTPLHDALQMLNLETSDDDEERTNLFRIVWNASVSCCVTWWCQREESKCLEPDPDSELYKEIRREAMYKLRSGIMNNDNLSVLEYATRLGLTECVQIMLTERDVFVKRIEDDETSRKEITNNEKLINKYFIDVSNLMPEYTSDASSKKEKFTETLTTVYPPDVVNGILEDFPMERLTINQWYPYQFIIYFFLFLHLGVMAWYTYEAQTSVHNIYNKRNSTEWLGTYHTSRLFYIDISLLTYAIIFFITYLFIYVSQEMKIILNATGMSVNMFSDYVETKGGFFNLLTYVAAFFAEYLAVFIALSFVISSITVLIFGSLDKFPLEYYAWAKGVAILSGWIIILIIGRVYSPIFNFIAALKYIFIKDMVPFLLFYLFLSIAFGCAIQLQFQLLSEETVEEFGTTWLVLFLTSAPHVVLELFVMTVGMDTDIKNIQDVGHMFTADKYGTVFVELLLLLYALTCLIILLNMLIGAMTTTYTQVLEKQGKGWRQYQVTLALSLQKVTGHLFDEYVRGRSKVEPVKNRWYMPVSKEDLKRIKVNYWNKSTNERDTVEQLHDIKNKLDTMSAAEEVTDMKKKLNALLTNAHRASNYSDNEIEITKL